MPQNMSLHTYKACQLGIAMKDTCNKEYTSEWEESEEMALRALTLSVKGLQQRQHNYEI